jgi:acyl transferase domain-containing protein/acyl carrier protein
MPNSASPDQQVLLALREARTRLEAYQKSRDEPIAVVGIGCRFPGTATPEEFWALLRDGVDMIGDMPADRPDFERYYDPDPAREGRTYTRRGGFLRNLPDRFEPQFFGISAREAEAMDPQQRMLLEVAWEALEHAGIAPDSLRRSATGVFAGVSTDDYLRLTTSLREPETLTAYSALGNAFSVAAGRISYFLGLQGPCIHVDTACSSSLVAVHLACQSLRGGESNLALAGGVNLVLSPMTPIWRCGLRALSPDGRCKTFDAAADGYGQGEGCGIVVLKRLSDAQADGDRVLALIRGSAVNHDGPSSGLTAPNGLAQEKLIRRALDNAKIDPGAVSYIEAHGTGTSLGDPIEVNALGAVFRDRPRPLLIGSVKSNIGHAEAAAGIACLIKTVLAVYYREIPPSLHFHNPNPYIPWEELPVRVVTERTAWPEGKRIAGVSSFGLSGTNAHVVVEEVAPVPEREEKHRPSYLLCLSAKTQPALAALARSYATYLEATSEPLADICHTANAGRSHFAYRLAILGPSALEIAQRLARVELPGASEPLVPPPLVPPKVAFHPGANADVLLEPVYSDRLADLYREGAAIDWRGFDASCRRVTLPGYPFQRERHWSRSISAVTPKSPVVDLLDREDVDGLGKLLGGELSQGERDLLKRLVARHNRSASDGLLYYVDWEPVERKPVEARGLSRGTWTIRGHLPGLAEQLRTRGESVSASASEASASEIEGRVLWILDAAADPTEQAVELLSLLHSAVERRARIWLVARGLHAGSYAQAAAWGIGKVVALEHPELWGGSIDLPAAPSPDDVSRLVEEVLGSDGEPQVMLRDGLRYVARLSRATLQPSGSAVSISPDGAYLVTGGTGAVGLQIARWLINRGARRIVLTGRHGTNSTDHDELRQSGADIRVAAVDAADAEQMRVLLKGLPDLRGVFHAAGVGGHRTIRDLDAESLLAVLRPKITGGWILHELTRRIALDFFVMFSSIASIWGSKAQAHYTAANQGLDALAWHRRSLGLPATSINWGPWAGTLTGEEFEGLRRSGVHPLQPAEAFEALDAVLRSAEAQVTVADVDWVRFRSVYEARGPQPLLARVGGTSPGVTSPGVTSPGDAPSARPPYRSLPSPLWRVTSPGDAPSARPRPKSRAEAVAVVRELVARVLGERELPDASHGFADLGLDSLMAVELKQLLEDRFGQPLSATVVFNYPTVDKLTDYLMGVQPAAAPVPAIEPTLAKAAAAPVDARQLMAMIAKEAEE